MNDSRIWMHPVSMTEIAPPQLKTIGNCVYEATKDGLELARCMPTGDSLLLPSTHNGSPLVAIGAGALSNSGDLRQVLLPRTIRCIGDYAFFQCSHLTEVRIKPGVESIGDQAFAGCSKLQLVSIPASVVTIGKDAFLGAKDLVIRGEVDSPIHRYALAHNLTFVAACDPNAA